MSYNISRFYTIKAENLKVELDLLINPENNDYALELPKNFIANNHCFLEFNGDSVIGGYATYDEIIISTINITGEFSNGAWNYVIKPALEKSTGHFDAIIVWECGDYIERIVFDDGVYVEQDVIDSFIELLAFKNDLISLMDFNGEIYQKLEYEQDELMRHQNPQTSGFVSGMFEVITAIEKKFKLNDFNNWEDD